MENIVTTLSLSKDLDKKIKEMARKRGQTKTRLIQEAVQDYIQRQDIEEIERKMQARARALGITSEDDVVEMVHEIRRAKK